MTSDFREDQNVQPSPAQLPSRHSDLLASRRLTVASLAAATYPPGWLSLHEHVGDMKLHPHAASLGRAVAYGECQIEIADEIIEGLLAIRLGIETRDWQVPDYVRQMNGPLSNLCATMRRTIQEIETERDRTAVAIESAARPLIERRAPADEIMALAKRIALHRSHQPFGVRNLIPVQPGTEAQVRPLVNDEEIRLILRDLWNRIHSRSRHRR